MSTSKATTAADEWRGGWPVVLSAMVGYSLFSVMLSGAGIFMEPLGKEFGWNRTILSAGPAIATIVTALLSPPVGMLIDRFGSRRLALPGILVTTAGMSAFGLITGSPMQWYVVWGLFGVALVMIKTTVWSAAVVTFFDKGRGLALGLTIVGTAVSQAAVPALGNWLIEDYGWRQAYAYLGLIWGLGTFVICYFLFKDGFVSASQRKAEAAAHAAAVASKPGLTVREALRSSALWRLLLSSFIVMLTTQGLSVHLFPILTESGISRAEAAGMLAISGAAAVVGKLATGVLLDRFRPNWIGGLTLAAAALVFAPLMEGARAPALIVLAMLANGYAAGTKTNITLYFAAGFGGMKNFGVIYGTMSAAIALAAGVGPLVAGVMYDHFGGYNEFLLFGVISCVVGGALVMSLPPMPRWTDAEEAEAEAALA